VGPSFKFQKKEYEDSDLRVSAGLDEKIRP